MALDRNELDGAVDDAYAEEADSDFDDGHFDSGSATSSAEEQSDQQLGKKSTPALEQPQDLDSGDEATIKERKKQRKKQKRKQDEGQDSSQDERDGQWRAKTRSMRLQYTVEKKKKSAATLRSSTIDVNKLWEEMNRPGPLPPVRVDGQSEPNQTPKKQETRAQDSSPDQRIQYSGIEETITIKRHYKFAGEVHIEEKIVPKSSAEARLWLAQQENSTKTPAMEGASKQRPLRKTSRFDPNYTNLDAFRNEAIKAQHGSFKGPKLNVVEKSKMDWVAHVDAEGLKEELDKHSKAKDAYLNRMDFLGQVEQRKEDEAKTARQKG